MFATEESTRQVILQDIEILFTPYGDEWVPGKATLVEGELPSAIFGPLKVSESYLLTLNSPIKGVMTESFQRTFDAQQVTEAIDQYLAKLSEPKKPSREQLQTQLLINVRAHRQ